MRGDFSSRGEISMISRGVHGIVCYERRVLEPYRKNVGPDMFTAPSRTLQGLLCTLFFFLGVVFLGHISCQSDKEKNLTRATRSCTGSEKSDYIQKNAPLVASDFAASSIYSLNTTPHTNCQSYNTRANLELKTSWIDCF